MPGIIVDIGCGDGKFVYQLAKEHPDRLIIGVDPSHTSLEKISAKIYKKPAKGGRENVFFVLANVEDLPEALNGLANQVFINFPWGSLLWGIVAADGTILKNIQRICQSGAFVDVVLSYDPVKDGSADLPELTLEYIQGTLASALAAHGIQLLEVKQLTPEELQTYPSTWAKKLSFGGSARQYYFMRWQIE
ncbi:methyltransferase domain-containing protein [Candidatus Falkowbacteria bacterium]|nr:methyltransferase domain-containing protein [Candidatus Falkowbacteria bacterium]